MCSILRYTNTVTLNEIIRFQREVFVFQNYGEQ